MRPLSTSTVRIEQSHALAQASLAAHNGLLENLLAREREQPAQLPVPRFVPQFQQRLTSASPSDSQQVWHCVM